MMKKVISMLVLLGLLVLPGLLGVAAAQEPATKPQGAPAVPPRYAASAPSVALAQAVRADREVDLKITLREVTAVQEPAVVDVQVDRSVDGQVVKATVRETRPRTVNKVASREVTVRLGKEGVIVMQVDGQPVTPEQVVERLAKPLPVLLSVGGAPDPYDLQTTRPDTLVVTMLALPPRPAAPAKPRGLFDPTVTEQQIIDLANIERQRANLPPLVAAPLLIKSARLHTANMARQNVMSHTLDGKGVAERLMEVGYSNAGCAENIAQGQRSTSEVVNTWMNSPGHRANLMGAQYTQIGVAFEPGSGGQYYWTMVLATPR